MEVVVLDGQSLFDLALQTAGSVEAMFDIAERNSLSVTDPLTAGSELVASDAVNKPVFEYYSVNGIKPATDATIAAMNELRDEGIDFWALEVDFVVQ